MAISNASCMFRARRKGLPLSMDYRAHQCAQTCCVMKWRVSGCIAQINTINVQRLSHTRVSPFWLVSEQSMNRGILVIQISQCPWCDKRSTCTKSRCRPRQSMLQQLCMRLSEVASCILRISSQICIPYAVGYLPACNCPRSFNRCRWQSTRSNAADFLFRCLLLNGADDLWGALLEPCPAAASIS